MFALISIFVFCFVLKEKDDSELGGQGGKEGSGRSWNTGKHSQNIVHEKNELKNIKIIFNNVISVKLKGNSVAPEFWQLD